ncbi:hypothetical protein GCM10009037_06820 [Halarchaeum grantii]|uniref:Restriction endonuclease type IV Mrr domain-containing protein n=1 Tax=Halarchaeum grantii TaxID=1193105 RepID=A0A830F730_9EURY|nr:restriction endonuclease [Halarchaeum grantii]GGL25838.1 hypothetical protein GCM10009037_06820 [Halarchaeum grantii]
MASAEELREHFDEIAEITDRSGSSRSQPDFNRAIPGLIESLGYDRDKLFFDVTYEPERDSGFVRWVNAAIKQDVTSPIWMTISTNFNFSHGEEESFSWPGHRGYQAHIDKQTLEEISDQTDAQYSVLISNHRIAYYNGFDFRGFSFEDLTAEAVREIFGDLRAPESLPQSEEESREDRLEIFHKTEFRRTNSDLKISIETDHYSLDLQKFWNELEAVRSAESPIEKGNSLERLSHSIFDGFPFIQIRGQNVRTSSAEIDLILEYQPPSGGTLFDDFGRYILVECKNWQRSVGADTVRDFKGKADSAKVDLGIIVASNGISGESGKDAVDELNQYYQRDDLTIIVIDESDLETIIRGNSLYEIIDEKIFNRRFRRIV